VEFTFGYRLVPDENEVVEKKDGSEGGDANVVHDTNEASATTTANERNDNAHDAVASSASATANTGEADVPQLTNMNNYRQVPAVGFLAQGWAGGVYPPHPLQNIPNWSCSIADILNTDFLPKSSIPPYDSKTHRGVWRSVTIRASLRTRECMVIVLHAPAKGGAGAREDGSDDYSSVFEEEKTRLIELLTKSVLPVVKRSFPKEDHDGASSLKGDDNEAENGKCVTSIFFQEYEGLSNPGPDHPVQVRYNIYYLSMH
jgi:hypothetical protein